MTNRVLNQSAFDGADESYQWATYCAATNQVRLRKRKPTTHSGKLEAPHVGTLIPWSVVPSLPGAKLADEVLQRVVIEYCTQPPLPKGWGSVDVQAPPYAAKDLAPGFEAAQVVERANRATADEMRDLDIEHARKPLEDAKHRARMLTRECLNDGTQQLSLVQYMAIFGEAP